MENNDNQFDDDKSENRNLIVNYIPASISEEALRNMFFPFGELESCKLMVDKLTGQSLGYGFIKYTTIDAAERAIAAMNGRTIDSKTLKVSVARPSSPGIQHANLYVSQLDKHVTKLVLDQIFSNYGKIIDSKILTGKDDQKIPRQEIVAELGLFVMIREVKLRKQSMP